MYLFSMRRWRDVNDAQDKAELEGGWASLCERLPWIAKQCSKEQFLDVVSRFHDDWQPNAGRARKKPRFDSTSPSNPVLSRGSTNSSLDTAASLDCSSPVFNTMPNLQPGAHRSCFGAGMLSTRTPSLGSLTADPLRTAHSPLDHSNNNGNLMSTVLKILHEQQRQTAQLQIASLTAALQQNAQAPVFPPINFPSPNTQSSPMLLPPVAIPNGLCNAQSLSPPCTTTLTDMLGLGKRDRACVQFT